MARIRKKYVKININTSQIPVRHSGIKFYQENSMDQKSDLFLLETISMSMRIKDLCMLEKCVVKFTKLKRCLATKYSVNICFPL